MRASRGGIEEERIVIILKHPDGSIKQRWTQIFRPAGVTFSSRETQTKFKKKNHCERSLS